MLNVIAISTVGTSEINTYNFARYIWVQHTITSRITRQRVCKI